MPEYLHQSWHPDLRHKARIAFLHVLTNQHPNTLCHQTEIIQGQIEHWLKSKGYSDVDLVFAGVEASIADEQKYDHAAGDLWRMWARTMVLSDIVIAHAHENGSAALGEFLTKAVNAAHQPSVVIIIPEGTNVSKAWRGQFEHHPNVKFVDVYGEGHDLTLALQCCIDDVLASRVALLTDGPTRRMNVELAVAVAATSLRRYWNVASPRARRDTARQLGLSVQHLQDHVEDSLLLASLGIFKVLAAQQLIVPSREDMIRSGQRRLSSKTMEAWSVWADAPNVDDHFAVWQLHRAIEAQTYADAGVAKAYDLTQPSLWEAFAMEDDGL